MKNGIAEVSMSLLLNSSPAVIFFFQSSIGRTRLTLYYFNGTFSLTGKGK